MGHSGSSEFTDGRLGLCKVISDPNFCTHKMGPRADLNLDTHRISFGKKSGLIQDPFKIGRELFWMQHAKYVLGLFVPRAYWLGVGGIAITYGLAWYKGSHLWFCSKDSALFACFGLPPNSTSTESWHIMLIHLKQCCGLYPHKLTGFGVCTCLCLCLSSEGLYTCCICLHSSPLAVSL